MAGRTTGPSSTRSLPAGDELLVREGGGGSGREGEGGGCGEMVRASSMGKMGRASGLGKMGRASAGMDEVGAGDRKQQGPATRAAAAFPTRVAAAGEMGEPTTDPREMVLGLVAGGMGKTADRGDEGGAAGGGEEVGRRRRSGGGSGEEPSC